VAALGRTERPQLVYAIGSPLGALVAGARIAAAVEVPLVVDLGDPWECTTEAERELRQATLGGAAALVTTTTALASTLGGDLQPGTPRLLAPAGGELRRRSSGPAGPPTFIHLSTVHDGRTPAAGAFTALTELDREGRIDFRSHTSAWITPGEPELSHHPLPLLPHDEALDLTAGSACALILGNRNPAQVPSKAYEIACTETWALCVSVLDPDPTVEVLREGGHAVVATDSSEESVRAAAEETLARERRGERPEPQPAHTWERRLDDIAGLIERVTGRRGAAPADLCRAGPAAGPRLASSRSGAHSRRR
ncbi:MAG: hypothetical protein ACR2K6_00860, partial [Solirubrobacterales bacterium]